MLHHLKKPTKHAKHKKTTLDYVLYFFAFTTPLFEFTQAYLIFSRQNATDVSLPTWGYFAISSIAWLWYGIHHKIWPLIFAYSLYLVIEATIVVGILIYG